MKKLQEITVTAVVSTFDANHPLVIAKEYKAGDALCDKNGNKFKRLMIESPSKINGLHVEPRQSSFTAYEESYLDGKAQFGWNIPAGDKFMGEFVTMAIVPEEIDDTDADGNAIKKRIKSSTVCVRPLKGQQEINDISIARAFAQAGHDLPEAEVEELEVKAEVPADGLTA